MKYKITIDLGSRPDEDAIYLFHELLRAIKESGIDEEDLKNGIYEKPLESFLVDGGIRIGIESINGRTSTDITKKVINYKFKKGETS